MQALEKQLIYLASLQIVVGDLANESDVGRPLVGLLKGNDGFYMFLPWRPTRGLPTFST